MPARPATSKQHPRWNRQLRDLGPARRGGHQRHSVDSSRRRQLLVALLSVIAGSADVLSFLVGRPVRCPRYRERGHPRRPPGHQEPEQSLARDLPETALRAASRSLTTQPSAAPATCSVAWVGKVAQGHVNRPRIDGKDGLRQVETSIQGEVATASRSELAVLAARRVHPTQRLWSTRSKSGALSCAYLNGGPVLTCFRFTGRRFVQFVSRNLCCWPVDGLQCDVASIRNLPDAMAARGAL